MFINIGEVLYWRGNEIYERFCFNKQDKFPTQSVGNFCDCLQDSLICDHIVLGIKNEQTTKKLLRIRDLTLNWCIDVCRSEEVTEFLLELADNINQLKSKKKKLQVQCQICKRCNKKNHFAKGCKGKDAALYFLSRVTQTWKRS